MSVTAGSYMTTSWTGTNVCWREHPCHYGIEASLPIALALRSEQMYSLLPWKAPDAFLTGWPVKNALNCFFTGEGWCIYSPPCPHSYIPHAISTRVTNTVDKCPIQSLGSVQTFQHFLASFSLNLQIITFSPICWTKTIFFFCCTEPIRLFKALWL